MSSVARIHPSKATVLLALIVGQYVQASGDEHNKLDWSAVGGDQSNERFSQLTLINKKNVAQLGGPCVRELGEPPRSGPLFDEHFGRAGIRSQLRAYR